MRVEWGGTRGHTATNVVERESRKMIMVGTAAQRFHRENQFQLFVQGDGARYVAQSRDQMIRGPKRQLQSEPVALNLVAGHTVTEVVLLQLPVKEHAYRGHGIAGSTARNAGVHAVCASNPEAAAP